MIVTLGARWRREGKNTADDVNWEEIADGTERRCEEDALTEMVNPSGASRTEG